MQCCRQKLQVSALWSESMQVSRYEHSASIVLQLSIDRELVATWQPNTPLIAIGLFVVDQSSFNKPVLGSIVGGLTEGIDRALHLTFNPRTGSTLALCDYVLCLRMCDQAKDARCMSSTCVSSQRTCFAIELCFIW